MPDDLIPPEDVAVAALEAIRLRDRLNRGGTAGTIAVAQGLADRAPLPVDKARLILGRLAEARRTASKGWDLPAAPSDAYVRFALLGGDPALRWLSAVVTEADRPVAVTAGLETVPRQPSVTETELAETNTALAAASADLGRIYETHAVRVAAWAESTVGRAIRAAGARTLDEVRNKTRRAALGGQEAQEAVAARIAALDPRERLSAVPGPIQAAVETAIERRIMDLIAESAVGSLEAILDAFHNRQIMTFAKLADITAAEAGRLFSVSVPTSNAVAVTQQTLVDLVLGRLDPGIELGTVDAARGLVPGSIANNTVLIAGGADINSEGQIVRDVLGRALGRDGGIADGGIGTFRTRLIDYGTRISQRDTAVQRITARLDIETGRPGAPSQAERDELLTELRALSEATPGRAGLGSGRLDGDAGRWIHGGAAYPFDPHLRLDGEEWFDLPGREIVCKNDGGAWPYNPIFYPGDHPGCTCFVEILLRMETAA